VAVRLRLLFEGDSVDAAHDRAEFRPLIDKYGWAVRQVFPTRPDEGVAFCYTVGLTAKGLPELSIYGLPMDEGHAILNEVAARMIERGSEFRAGELIDGILVGTPLLVIEMGDTHELTAVENLYGEVRARQLVWSDREGRMPWEDWDNPPWVQPIRDRPRPDIPVGHGHALDGADWPFEIPVDTAVFTTRPVLEGHPILYVFHDIDGDWQFMCGTTTAEEDARLVCLGCMVSREPELAQLADLPLGWNAYRYEPGGPWDRAVQLNEGEGDASS
jgi:hypothetical protein